MGDNESIIRKFINKVKDFLGDIIKKIKFLITPVGQIIGWLLLIVLIVILFSVIGQVATRAIARLIGINWNYSTFDDDLEVIKQLNVSGYESSIDAENFQNFKSFEYAVLMDAADYLKNTKQEMFDIVKNEGAYTFERNLIKTAKPDEYSAKISELSKKYANVGGAYGEATSVPLMYVSHETNQEGISDSALQSYINSSFNSRNVKVTGIDQGGSIKGGTNRVNGPFLAFEFTENSYSGDKKSSSGDNKSGETSGDVSGDKSSSGDKKGSLEPYIYINKEDIEFTYYFDSDNKVIEYPLLLNAYNGKLNVGTENSAELNRALLGISPVVFPDQDVSQYTKTAYYTNKTTPVRYKIPLRTILGRYMPKAELLMAWSYVKQNVERDTKDTDELGIMDYTISAIKGIYNEACLLGESNTKTIEGKNSSGETIKYTADESHNKTFVTFEKAGIESTRYDIDGLKPIEGEDGEANIKLVTNFISAIVINPEFDVDYKVTYTSQQEEATVGSTEEQAAPSITIVDDKIHISLDNLNISGLIKGNYILADGTPEGGYSPPYSLDGIDGYYVPTKNENEVSRIIEKIRSAVIAYITEQINKNPQLSGVVEITSFPDDIVKFNPIFLANDTRKVEKKLKIEHTRMPILLVKSATTWCREVTYEHTIMQNQFKQYSKKYIIPKSVSSIGLSKFSTTVVSDGYRGRAYSEVFSRVQEKDVINMLMMLEMSAKENSSDSYEYMRDLYKLVLASREYSKSQGITSTKDPRFIHEDTYKYVYIPDSILYFDDSQSQKIYWLNLLTATADDPISKEELNNFKTKDTDITWQLVEYNKYEECNKNGSTKVYALSPFGSQYVRTYYETLYNQAEDVSGKFKRGSHNGADWTGREKADDILQKGNSFLGKNGIGGKIYNYELNRMKDNYGEETSKARLKEVLSTEKKDMPIVATAPGRVVSVSYDARSGFYVEIIHSESENVCSCYMHLKRWPLVNVGDFVGAGTLLGYEGCTGRSFGAHLHFEIRKNGIVEPPEEYIFPTFNPFYYEEKAAEVKYDLTNEYMSLQRTVTMVGSNAGSEAKITNKVPSKSLVGNYASLIQNQGSMAGRSYSNAGDLDWNSKEQESVEAYCKYLESEDIYDIYLREAYFDKKKATEEGYLESPFVGLLNGDIIVKTDIPGALPELTESELKTILNGYLNSRYKNKAKVDWLMNNIFTQENINFMLQKEKETKVSIVFMIAVAVQEQNLGLCDNRLSRVAHNIFSIKGIEPVGGYIIYQKPGLKWRKFNSYKDAMNRFMELIANGNYYFKKGNYTINTIGPIYCGTAWSQHVTSHVLEIMKFYPGNWLPPTSTVGTFGNAGEWLNLASKGVKWLAEHEYGYNTSGGYIPYVTRGADGSWIGSRYNAIDCSTYVSWMIHEFGVEHNIPALINFGDRYSGQFQELAESIKRNPTSGVNQCFDVVFADMSGLASHFNVQQIHEMLQDGDILIYRKNKGHVDIFAGWVNPSDTSSSQIYKFSCGMAPRSKSEYRAGKPYSYNMGKSSGGDSHGWWDVTGIIRLKTVN